MLPFGLDVEAVSTSDFGVSGTDRGVGRVIIAEGADDALIGGGLREQISIQGLAWNGDGALDRRRHVE